MFHITYDIPGEFEIRFYLKRKGSNELYDWFYSIPDALTYDNFVFMECTDDDNYVVITDDILSRLLKQVAEFEKEEKQRLDVLTSVTVSTKTLVEMQEQKILEVKDHLELLVFICGMIERMSIQIEFMRLHEHNASYPYESIVAKIVDL